MDTQIEFLRRFEDELSARAKADARREASPKPTYPRRWKPWVAAAALLLVAAAGIGALATSGLSGSQASMAASGAVQAPEGNPGDVVPAPAPSAVHGVAQANQGQLGFVPARRNGAVHAPANIAGSSTGTADVQQKAGGTPAQAQPDLSKIMRDGQIAITIDDGSFKAKAGSVAHIAAVNGGSILSSSTEGGDSGSFTIRIPAANFDKAMVQLAQLGTVDSSASQGQDVTAEYVDLKAHMKIYVSRRKVLFGLMDKATTIGQSLALQNQLDQVQLKIDQITGQITYINKQVAESTIKVDLHEPGAAVADNPDSIDKPNLGRAWDRAVQGLLNVIAVTLIGLGYLIPLLIVAGIVYLLVRLVRQRRVPAGEA